VGTKEPSTPAHPSMDVVDDVELKPVQQHPHTPQTNNTRHAHTYVYKKTHITTPKNNIKTWSAYHVFERDALGLGQSDDDEGGHEEAEGGEEEEGAPQVEGRGLDHLVVVW
jgi:hypothetical protein